MVDSLFHYSIGTALKQFNPAVDIAEDKKCYEINCCSWCQKQDFKIDLIDGELTISGERKLKEGTEDKNFYSLETQYISFSRSIFISEAVIEDQVESAYEDGMLKLILPKCENLV